MDNKQAPEYIIADRGLTVWSFYDSKEAAEADLPRVLAGKAADVVKFNEFAVVHEHRDPGYWQQRAADTIAQQWAVTTWAEFEAAQSTRILEQPLYEVAEHQWMDMLEVLPPVNWGNRDGFNSFFMSEFDTGSYTRQYARQNGRYFYKVVDYHRPDTWIKADMIPNAVDKKEVMA